MSFYVNLWGFHYLRSNIIRILKQLGGDHLVVRLTNAKAQADRWSCHPNNKVDGSMLPEFADIWIPFHFCMKRAITNCNATNCRWLHGLPKYELASRCPRNADSLKCRHCSVDELGRDRGVRGPPKQNLQKLIER